MTAFLLLSLGHVQAEEPPSAIIPSILGQPKEADVGEAPEFVPEAAEDELSFEPGHAVPANDLEGAAVADDVSEGDCFMCR